MVDRRNLDDDNKKESMKDREKWAANVKERLGTATDQLQHDEKRSMQLGGTALVLAAVGGALLVRAIILLVNGDGALGELATFPVNCAVMSVPQEDAKADAESSNAEPARTAKRTENTFDKILIGC